MIERYEKLTSAISEISRLINKISADVMSDFGLKGTLAKYILVMKRHRMGITATRLTVLCERNKSDVSRALAEMEELGIIFKVSSGRYRIKMALTERGLEIAEKLSERAMEVISYVGKDISDEARETLYNSLDSIAQNLEAIGDGLERA